MATAVYTRGEYFSDPLRHSEDAVFKATEFLDLFGSHPGLLNIRSYADVGCGSGAATIAVAEGLRQRGAQLTEATGYDVSPHVRALSHKSVHFMEGTFGSQSESVDLVTMFDVIEHVPAPIHFLKEIASHAKILGLHIPLDNSANVAIRDGYRGNLKDPGHLIALDTASALNLLAFAGLQTMDYKYTLAFKSPSGHQSFKQKLIYPLRWGLSLISPWILSKTLGGVSLMVLAITPLGMEAGLSG
jgi:SAM-dependent methyltransferase